MKVQFSIRDLLLIIAIIALAAGWWIDHQRINKMAMQKWEYKIAKLNDLDAELGPLGADGWELCGVPDRSEFPRTVFLKRPMP